MKCFSTIPGLFGSALLLFSGASSAALFTVGSGAGCTDTTVASAVAKALANGAASDIIRINSGTYSAQAVQIADQALSLSGGYATCTENTPTGAATTLSGAGNGGVAVIAISAPGATRRVISLQNLTITQGGAGGVRVFGNLQMDVSNVIISNNNATNGGGLYVQAASSAESAVVQLNGSTNTPSRIENNSASNGGGIYVDNFAFVALNNVVVTGNTANVGGGVFGSGSNSQIGITGFPSSSPDSGVRGNTALFDGGGAYIQSGASLSSSRFSNDSPPPTIADNNAGRNGGGAYFASSGGFLLGYNLVVRGNNAGTTQNGNGGGLYFTANTSALLDDGGESTTCGQPEPCTAIENNRAGLNGFTGGGGGVYLIGGGGISAVRAHIAGNQAPTGAAIYAIGANSTARLSSAVVENNAGAGHSIRMEAGAALELRGVTFGNDATAQGMIALSGGSALIDSSILYDPGATLITRVPATTNTVTSNCVLAHAPYASDTGTVLVGNPLFVNAAVGDYSLMDASPAIDACANVPFLPGETDYAERVRGVDAISVPNNPGPYDLGALEKHPVVIYLNSFE